MKVMEKKKIGTRLSLEKKDQSFCETQNHINSVYKLIQTETDTGTKIFFFFFFKSK